MKKILKRGALVLLILLVGAGLFVYFYLKGTLPTISGEVKIEILESQVVVTRNSYGVPRIDAESPEDMYMAIGFIHASDRLFQMDLTRRLATGKLSEIFGKRTLETDIYRKELMIEESIEKILKQKMDKKLKLYLKKYCDGVNYFIQHRTLPPEFRLLGFSPDPWTPADAFSIFKNMENILAGSGRELNNLKIKQAFGEEVSRKLIEGNFGQSIINEEEYDNFFKNSSLQKSSQEEMDRVENGVGSNNWVVSGKKTKSGLPLLANDPHLSNVFPSYFYQIYASAEGMEFSGNTIAGIPFIIIGRNKFLGWGFTNVGTDVIDYYELQTDEKGERYKVDGEWKTFTKIQKTIKVKGEKDHIALIKVSDFGPVMKEGDKYYARHSVMLYPSTVLDAVYGMNFAKNVTDFLAALRQFSSPAQNVVFADKLGNIGYYPTGKIPKRRLGDGSLPVKIEKLDQLWDGFIDESEKPFLFNPEKGYIVTANNPVIPKGKLPLYAFKWSPSFRADRIDQLLNRGEKLDLSDMKNIQTDSYLMGAEFLINRLKGMYFKDKDARELQTIFKNWNLSADSGAAPALFYQFQVQLARHIFQDNLKNNKYQGLISYHWVYRILNYPEFREDRLSEQLIDDVRTEKKETLKDIMESALSECYREYRKKGAASLKWENIHELFYKHPLGSVPVVRGLLNKGPFPVKGGRDCILVASFGRGSFKVSHLSTFRMVIDFSDFSKSVMVNSSGQSGHFMSDYYDDQIQLYVDLKYRKMEDFRDKSRRLILKPGKN